MLASSWRAVWILSLLGADGQLLGADAKKHGGDKKQRRRMREGRSTLGAWSTSSEPMHKVQCGDHVCRPGEGNLKGYSHWKQPYEHMDFKPSARDKTAPGWTRANPFPAQHYTGLIEMARRASQPHGFVVLTAADFDFRLMALNWHRAAVKAGVANGLVHALDPEAFGFLHGRGVPTHNGTAALEAWQASRLRRHIQRALAERHMAAAALVDAGISTLLMDTSSVILKPLAPYFSSEATRALATDVMAMRSRCRADKERTTGCELLWTLVYFRGAPPAKPGAPRDTRVLDFIRAAIETGLVDFYLRWWAAEATHPQATRTHSARRPRCVRCTAHR